MKALKRRKGTAVRKDREKLIDEIREKAIQYDMKYGG